MRLARAWHALVLLFTLTPFLQADSSQPADVSNEMAGAFYSFRQYMETALYHPQAGYYSGGHANIGVGNYPDLHFWTFPEILTPYFGELVAETVFRMDASLKEPTLSLIELGSGSGRLANDFLAYAAKRSKQNDAWKRFWDRQTYIAVDINADATRLAQERNQELSSRFRAVTADARLLSTVISQPVSGVVFANELLDVLSVEKVRVSASGSIELAYVIPVFTADTESLWKGYSLSTELLDRIQTRSTAWQLGLSRELRAGERAVDRSLLDESLRLWQAMPNAQRTKMIRSIRFIEWYLPLRVQPALVPYLRPHLARYADWLASNGQPSVTFYLMPDLKKIVHSIDDILSRGYVVFIDYGYDQNTLLHFGESSLRMFGPKRVSRNESVYKDVTLYDITVDVPWTDLIFWAQQAGWEMVFYGPQSVLAKNAPERQVAYKAGLQKWPEGEKRSRTEEALRGFLNDYDGRKPIKVVVFGKKNPPFQFSKMPSWPTRLKRQPLGRKAKAIEQRLRASVDKVSGV